MSTLGLIFCLLGSVFTKRRHFRPDPFLSCAERWQDSRAVRDSRGPCSERRPLPGRIFARCVPERRFAGLFGCMARISCQSQPVFGCMARESCRELAIFPSEAAFGMHGAQNLPRIDARERTVAKSCHYQSPENAFRAYPAIAGRLGMHSVDTLPLADIRECTASAYRHCQSPVTQRSPREGVGSGPWLRCGVWRTILSVRGSGHSVSSGLNCWERFRVCAVSVGNHELASRSAKLCRIMC